MSYDLEQKDSSYVNPDNWAINYLIQSLHNLDFLQGKTCGKIE